MLKEENAKTRSIRREVKLSLALIVYQCLVL